MYIGWLKIVVRFGQANQSALFTYNIGSRNESMLQK